MSVPTNGYVPVLLTRLGERQALKDFAKLSWPIEVVPLLVVPPVEWDFVEEAPAKSLTQHVEKLPAELEQAWSGRTAFIDLLELSDDGSLDNGEHPLEWITRESAVRGVTLIPVVSPARSPEYRTAVSTVVARDGNGVCVRLGIDEWPSSGGTSLQTLLTELSVSPTSVDLVLDLRDQTGQLAVLSLHAEISSLPNLADWRSVAVIATAMPKEMPSGQGLHVIQRGEWLGYRELLARSPSLRRTPTFGDFAIAHPDPAVDVDFRYMQISATLRYTTGDDWLIAKGPLFKASGGRSLGAAAVPPAIRHLQPHEGYLDPDHCDFELWCESVLAGASGGNPTTWRHYGNLHHLNVVTNQVASFRAT